MKNQTLSISRMRHLQELGIDTSKGSVYEMTCKCGEYVYPLFAFKDSLATEPQKERICFTLQDIIELLPKQIKTDTDTYWLTISIYDCKEWSVCYSMSDEFDYYKEFKSESLLEAAYQMLCWCAENGYLKGGEK